MLKMCCAAGGEDRSASAGLSDLDLFCGWTVTVASTRHTEQNPMACRMKGIWGGKAENSQVGRCCYEKPELQMA